MTSEVAPQTHEHVSQAEIQDPGGKGQRRRPLNEAPEVNGQPQKVAMARLALVFASGRSPDARPFRPRRQGQAEPHRTVRETFGVLTPSHGSYLLALPTQKPFHRLDTAPLSLGGKLLHSEDGGTRVQDKARGGKGQQRAPVKTGRVQEVQVLYDERSSEPRRPRVMRPAP